MKKRRLSPGEDALWQRTTRDVQPLVDRETGESQRALMGEVERPVFSVRPNRDNRGIMDSAARRALTPMVGGKKSSVVGAGDPAQDKRVSRRRMAIDRRIDLHGMTQIAAEVALTAFLAAARKDGCRCVLVITGKGGISRRGVLHSRFSEWVNSEMIKPIVARAAPAHQKDGGAGAWYVFLKRKN